MREALVERDLDAYYGLSAENARYLTGFVLGDGEEKVSGSSGHFFVAADASVVLADSRYRAQAETECPDSRVELLVGRLVEAWPALVASLRPLSGSVDGMRRLGVESGFLSHAGWLQLAAAVPQVELVPVEGLVEGLRMEKEPSELERVSAACGVADAALQATLGDIAEGVTERDLALALEWRIRRSEGVESLAFDVACLSGPRAALPHGSPGERRITPGEVLLFDFGARVEGYRSDMTRTLFVGAPNPHDEAVYELVARAQSAAFEAIAAALAAGRAITNREVDAAARDVIDAAGHAAHFGHGTGHGIGLATHELPSLGRVAAEEPLPTRTVFSIEPGIYLDGVTGVRIEDLVAFDRDQGKLELLTHFPRQVTVVGA